MKITKELQKRLILIAAFAVSFAMVLTLATFFDLNLNIAVYNANSFFGQVVSNIGETPSYIAITFAAVVFYQSVSERVKNFILFKILSGVLLIIATYFLVDNIFSNLASPTLLYQSAYCIVFAAALAVLLVFATNHVDKRVMHKLALFAIFLVVVVAVSQGIVYVAKHMVGRMRFRNMVDGEGFTPWYVFHFGTAGREALIAAGSVKPGDAFKSLPSGHTANSAILFALVFLPNIFPRMKKLKPFFFGFAAVWTIMVAFARIVVGAHFLSDVLIGGSVTLAVTALTKWLFEYVYRKKGKSMVYDGYGAGGGFRRNASGGSTIISVDFSSEVIDVNAEDVEQ